MDTTLRDGEQTESISFSKSEKFAIAKKLLSDVKVDRIEITSARVSEGEKEASRMIFEWAKKKGYLDNVEVLGFVDKGKSIKWISEAGGKVINLLAKGSKKHCKYQLKKSPEEHYKDVVNEIKLAKKEGFIVNAYLEDFSSGVREDFSYVTKLITKMKNAGINRVMLADTLGVLNPLEALDYVTKLRKKFPRVHFDFHAHNDYGLATANSLAAIKAGVNGVHTTVNGLGERTGNASLSEVVPAINDFAKESTKVNEMRLSSISKLVEIFSRQRIAKNAPIVGANVFTQTAGIHADGDKKGGLYVSKLSPKRFGRNTRYALGKLSGKASVIMTLRNFGINLEDDDLNKVLSKVKELGDKKEYVTKEDLLFMVDELVLNGVKKKFEIEDYEIISSKNKKPKAKIKVIFDGKKYSQSSFGDGGYDAFVSALSKIFKKKKISFPKLIDYEVRIPAGGRTDALVETKITWKRGNRTLETIGVSTDQTAASVKATEKMVNLILKLN
jgi:D-citramalate synthase